MSKHSIIKAMTSQIASLKRENDPEIIRELAHSIEMLAQQLAEISGVSEEEECQLQIDEFERMMVEGEA